MCALPQDRAQECCAPTRQERQMRPPQKAAATRANPRAQSGVTVSHREFRGAVVGRQAEAVKAAASHRTPDLGMGFEEFAEDGGSVFAEFAISRAEGGEEVGVDIEFTDNLAVDEDGDDDFGFGF